MPGGTPIGRPWVVVLRNGTIAVDWGDGSFQDAISGEFLKLPELQVSYCAQDADLDWLIRIGRVSSYNAQQVYFVNLPERSKSASE